MNFNQELTFDQRLENLRNFVKRFSDNYERYKYGDYNEANVRVDFIDPFFELLGWDVGNRQGYSELYRDVVREDTVSIEGKAKAPDYSFRIGGARKFFVEAKRPSFDLKTAPEPAIQVRRYGYSAKLPFSILTDFEEFAVYNTRIQPKKNDTANIARVFYCNFREYEKNFEFIYNTFSREAILKGYFDRFAEKKSKDRGVSEVDEEFLKLIEKWRGELAQNIALRNPDIDVYHLNIAVQRIIDRIIFIRIAEDRNMEEYGGLKQTLHNGAYSALDELFRKADDKYNSGLFKPEKWISELIIDDKVLAGIINNFYPYECPYELSVMPIETLGSIYERFLGKTIRFRNVKGGHTAIVEEKPEVRKAGGVYYTPEYIVDYIIDNTLGVKLDEFKTPAKITELRILDPACGSGSFLVGAYNKLIAYHLDYYLNNNRDKALREGRIYQVDDKTYRLSINEKQSILLNNIYGVDIDIQAVEVTKLSLLLKLMEGEQTEGKEELFKHSDFKWLPDLSNNIRCGNSLISSDFYSDKQMSLFGDEDLRRINVFDWEKEFERVFKAGGFDIVIGNPPYVRQESLSENKPYFKTHYNTYHGIADLYVYFIEKGISLLKSGGFYGVIVANKWMRSNYGEPLRLWLKQKKIRKIIDFGELPVFKGASTFPMILILENSNIEKHSLSYSAIKTLDFDSLDEQIHKSEIIVDKSQLQDSLWFFSNKHEFALLKKIENGNIHLYDYVNGKIYRGILTGLNEAFVIDGATRARLIKEDPKSKEIIKPFLAGRDIKRYQPLKTDKYLIFTRRGIEIKIYPAILKYLMNYKESLMPKPIHWKGSNWKGRKPGHYKWYEIQDTIDYYKEFEKPKIVLPDIAKESRMTFDTEKIYIANTGYIIPHEDKYLIGVLNSKLIYFYYKRNSAVLGDEDSGGRLRWIFQYIKNIPIPMLDLEKKSDKQRHDRMVELVEEMLEAQKKLSVAGTDIDKKSCETRVNALDNQINALVYELYGLDDKEIEVIEG
jgi:type I restriction-modification system DNA methylase subunit